MVLNATGVSGLGWFYLSFLVVVFEVLLACVGVVGMIPFARRSGINMTEISYIQSVMAYTGQDWRSLLRRRRFSS